MNVNYVITDSNNNNSRDLALVAKRKHPVGRILFVAQY